MIVFFSGTGNSRYCAQMLAAGLGDELIDAFNFIRDGIAAELCSARPWVFVAPTYGWQLPHIFTDFIRSGSFTGCKKVYFVMTCGSEIGGADTKISSLCAEKGFDFQGVLEVIMPENYVAMFDVPDAAEAEKIIAAARPVLESGIEAVRQGIPFPERKKSAVDRLKSGIVNRLFYALFVKANGFYSGEKCTGCGRCERACPLKNIQIKNARPVWGGECTHCMACICGCPTEAIEYGRHSVGKPRYQCGEYRGQA